MGVSIKDVAMKVGVSDVTVSLALRDDPRISVARRKHIRQVAQELGYVPNPLARGLRGQATRSVGVLWSLGGPHDSGGMVRQITLKLQRRGYVNYVADHLADPEVAQRLLSSMAQRRVDAVVIQIPDRYLFVSLLPLLKLFRTAVVVSDGQEPRPLPPMLHVIAQDRGEALAEAARHLARSGRRRPAYLIHASSNPSKVQVVQQTFAQEGVSMPQEAILDVLPTAMHDVSAVLDRAWGAGKFDALLCGTDQIAIAAMHWLHRHGLRIPEDVAVVGFNDSVITPYIQPPLASIARRDDEVAQAIERMLFAGLAEPQAPQQFESIPMRFVWRESAGGQPPP